MSEVVAVVGLGYAGLPLAVEFGKKFDTVGFDLSAAKIDSYRRFCDPTGEVSSEDMRAAARLTPTTDPSELRRADFIVIAVPTPVDVAHIPDFIPLIGASTTVAQCVSRRHRRGLRPHTGAPFGLAMEAGFSCRLLS
jgi:UDP-N-acetyl-D-galactosamine dehydrogenase